MSAIKKKHFSWAGNQEKKVPSYTLQQYRVSHIKNWVNLWSIMLFSFCFGNLVFGCFWDKVTKILRISLFNFFY